VTLTFDLILIDGRGIAMDYSLAILVYAVLVLSCTHTETQMRMIAILMRLSSMSVQSQYIHQRLQAEADGFLLHIVGLNTHRQMYM